MKKTLLGVLVLLAVPFISFADSVVTSSAGTGASISPSGSTLVLTGVTQVFTIGAQNGYRIGNVLVDGSSVGAVGSYDLLGDLVDHSISVSAYSISNVLPFCSGPLAPGWNVSMVGGGCGGTEVFLPAGSPGCPWFIVSGCILPR